MIRDKFIDKRFGADKYFNWRGDQISRLESFSDAVFAFAVTLLVVSLEAPKSFDQLLDIVKGFVAFGICFTLLILIWYKHYVFFRRYGINNIKIVVLNSILMFVLIFYIYPLKFLFSILVYLFFPFMRPESFEPMISFDQAPMLMIIYGMGCLLTFLVFFFMYLHVYKKREELELNEIEITITKSELVESSVYIIIPVISILFVVLGGPNYSPLSGWIYMLLGPVLATNGILTGKKIKKLLNDDQGRKE